MVGRPPCRAGSFDEKLDAERGEVGGKRERDNRAAGMERTRHTRRLRNEDRETAHMGRLPRALSEVVTMAVGLVG